MERAFNIKKAFFIILKELSIARNCLRPKSKPLRTIIVPTLDALQLNDKTKL